MADRIRNGSLLNRAIQEVADRTGYAAVPQERLALLEAGDVERRAMQKEMDLLGWYVLDVASGQPTEVKVTERRRMVQQARYVWTQDPQAGAAVDLMNDFTFGRGVPRPKCADEKVQEIVDEAWDDPDNKRALTTYKAQVALGVDLSLQSNIFVLFFDDGSDGKVKLSILPHDTVEDAVRDEHNYLKVLYFIARKRVIGWDFINDTPRVATLTGNGGQPRVFYYEALDAAEEAEEARADSVADLAMRDSETDEGMVPFGPPPEKLGEGRVYHIAVNRMTEQVFGVPTMRRQVKWLAAYNDFMAARVDMAQAAAAFIMKRRVRGTPGQVAKIAAKAISRRSDLAATSIDDPDAGAVSGGPRPASILNETDSVSHESMNLNTNAGQAQQDAQMIRAQISASTRFPQSYFGDASQSNLATATSLELPVLKAVEARQELFEGLYRAFIDRVIKRAVDAGRIPRELTEEERAALKEKKQPDTPYLERAGDDPMEDGTGAGAPIGEGYVAQEEDEDTTERDLGYEFNMPNPLKRTVVDLTTAISNIARTFDPNNTNMELSRILLTIVLGEGLEIQDPASAVEKVYPPGYQDPAIVAAQQAQEQAAAQSNFFGPDATGEEPGAEGADGDQHRESNAYGAPRRSTPPEKIQQAAVHALIPRTRATALDELWNSEIGEVMRHQLALSGENGRG